MSESYKTLRAFADSLGEQALHDILDTLEQFGVLLPQAPVGDIEHLPSNLSDMTPDDVGTHLSQWASLAGFMHTLQGAAIVVRDAVQADYDELWAKKQMRAVAVGKTKIQDTKAYANADPDVVAKRKMLRKIEGLVEMLGRIASSYDRNYQAVSRQVGLLEADMRRTR